MFLSHSAAAASASSSSRDRLRASNSGVKYLMASFSWHAWAAIRRKRGPQAIVRRGESGAKPSGRDGPRLPRTRRSQSLSVHVPCCGLRAGQSRVQRCRVLVVSARPLPDLKQHRPTIPPSRLDREFVLPCGRSGLVDELSQPHSASAGTAFLAFHGPSTQLRKLYLPGSRQAKCELTRYDNLLSDREPSCPSRP